MEQSSAILVKSSSRPHADGTSKAAADLVFFGRMLHERHYLSGTDGNLSIHRPFGNILITPSGVSKHLMQPEDMIVVDMNGQKIGGGPGMPSTEMQMHLLIYTMRPDVGAVVHAHPCTATAFACVGMDLSQSTCSELVLSLGKIPLAPYAPPGTSCLAEALRPHIADYDVVLMESHGVVACGSDIERAYLNMETAEHCARITLLTHLLGEHTTLSEEESSRLRDVWIRKRAMARYRAKHHMNLREQKTPKTAEDLSTAGRVYNVEKSHIHTMSERLAEFARVVGCAAASLRFNIRPG